MRDSAVLMAASVVIHACNASFQIIMGRMLPADEFALLAALLSLVGLASLPLGTLQSSISTYTRLLINENRSEEILALLHRWILRMSFASLALLGLMVAAAYPLMDFLRVNRIAPILLLAPLLLVTLFGPLFDGINHGMSRFGWLSAAATVGALIRVCASAAFAALIAPAAGWALLGHTFGQYVLVGLLALPIFLHGPGTNASTHSLPRLRYHLGPSFILLFGMSVLTFGDMVLVKTRFPELASVYAYASLAARMVVFLPSAIAVAMFPRVVADKGRTTVDQYKTFFKSTLLTAGCLAPALWLCTLFPGTVAGLLFGVQSTHPLQIWIPLLAWSLVPVALLNVAVRYCIAQHRFLIASPVIVASSLYLFAAYAWAKEPGHLILTLGLASGFAWLVTTGLLMPRPSRTVE